MAIAREAAVRDLAGAVDRAPAPSLGRQLRRYAPIGITVGHAFRGHVLRRFAESQLVVDESWALSGGGTPAAWPAP